MKKVLKFFLWINAAALFILNLSVSLNLVDINSIKLTLKQEQALADECGGGGYWHWVCDHCMDPYGNPMIVYTCIPSDHSDCFHYPCIYGTYGN